MAYSNYGNRGGYQQRSGGNNYGGGQQQGYNQAPPPRPPFNMDEEISKRLDLFIKFAEAAENKGLKMEEIAPYLGGWITSLLLDEKKQG